MPKHWGLLWHRGGHLIALILHSWEHVEELQFASSLLYQLTGGYQLGTNTFCLRAFLLPDRSWSDPEGPVAYLVHELSKEISLAHQDTQIWTEVSCLRLTSDLYGSEPLEPNCPIPCAWDLLSYRVSKPLLSHQHYFNLPRTVFFPLSSKPSLASFSLKIQIVKILGFQDMWPLYSTMIL